MKLCHLSWTLSQRWRKNIAPTTIIHESLNLRYRRNTSNLMCAPFITYEHYKCTLCIHKTSHNTTLSIGQTFRPVIKNRQTKLIVCSLLTSVNKLQLNCNLNNDDVLLDMAYILPSSWSSFYFIF
jgi:hypothetical protein